MLIWWDTGQDQVKNKKLAATKEPQKSTIKYESRFAYTIYVLKFN